LRWWQPRHNGTGHDQWALDHVEVVLDEKSYIASKPDQTFMTNHSAACIERHFLTCVIFHYLLSLVFH
ncbi:RELN isoform 4, partial [Pan troglodytes]